MRDADFKKGCRSLNVGRIKPFTLIDQLRGREDVNRHCSIFEVSRSSYYGYRNRKRRIDSDRIRLRIKVTEIFNISRQSAGSRTIVDKMREEGEVIGQFKVRRLMKEARLESKQPKLYAYAGVRLDLWVFMPF